MLDGRKKTHRPERLKDYDYSRPGCYFVTFNTKTRGENILCNVVTAREAEASLVGPDLLVRPFPQSTDSPQQKACCVLTQAGEVIQSFIDQIDTMYSNASVDCYSIMPDHVHLLIWLWGASPESGVVSERNGLTRRSGPTRGVSLSQIVRALKTLSSKRVGYSLWQERYYDHIIRNQEDLENTRQYIQNNPLKWISDEE